MFTAQFDRGSTKHRNKVWIFYSSQKSRRLLCIWLLWVIKYWIITNMGLFYHMNNNLVIPRKEIRCTVDRVLHCYNVMEYEYKITFYIYWVHFYYTSNTKPKLRPGPLGWLVIILLNMIYSFTSSNYLDSDIYYLSISFEQLYVMFTNMKLVPLVSNSEAIFDWVKVTWKSRSWQDMPMKLYI